MNKTNTDKADQTKSLNEMRRVILYSASACVLCNELRNYLIKNNIDFIEKDVIRDQSAAIEMMRRSKRKRVPQVVVDDILIIGYDKYKLDKLFAVQC